MKWITIQKVLTVGHVQNIQKKVELLARKVNTKFTLVIEVYIIIMLII